MTTTTDRLVVDLDEEAALDPHLAGAKAAWLARARRLRLPVLPGRVVLAPASVAALAAGRRALAASGSGAARMAVTALGVPADIVEAVRGPWPQMAVRSSSPLEGSGEWSGAFTTYLDVAPAELAKAIGGCWASSFTVSTLERFQAAGVEPPPMAVLVQPFLQAEAGGLATVVEDLVMIESVAGSPAGLLSGRQPGHWSQVDLRSGTVVGHTAPAIREAASLAGKAREASGATQIEWLAADGEVWICQLAAPLPRAVPEPAAELPIHPQLLRVARIVRRFPGQAEASLVLPWALSLADPAALDEVEPITGGDVTAIEKLAREMTNRVWQSSIGVELAATALAELAGDPLAVLPTLARLRPVDLDQARRLVGLIRGQRSAETAPSRPGRFEPLGAAVTEAWGRRSPGIAASPGNGFGLGVVVSRGVEVGPRRVIVAREPIPNLAPLLWTAAGLVTLTGSPAAHLFASARSLGVPAVAGVDLDLTALQNRSAAVAVNGHRGTISIADW